MSSFFKRSLPHCELLDDVRVLSIKLGNDVQRRDAGREFLRTKEFEPINFLIRDEEHGKRTVMNAKLICNQGFRVQQQDSGDQVMRVTLPEESSDLLGKIVHPQSGATVHQLFKSDNTYRLRKTSDPDSVLLIRKERVSMRAALKMIGILSTSCYRFKDMNGAVLGSVRPKMTIRKNTLIVKFKTGQGDAQVRAAMLGTALLFVLHKAYPELGKLLQAITEEHRRLLNCVIM